jgi:hypothetical protein
MRLAVPATVSSTLRMHRISEDVARVRKIVVFFDICSSATLLEDLLRTENEFRWLDLLTGLKKVLRIKSKEIGFEIYKFLGDGWILLFDEDSITGADLMLFLARLCLEYDQLFKSNISDVLSIKHSLIGLTFGIDLGTLVKIVMNARPE